MKKTKEKNQMKKTTKITKVILVFAFLLNFQSLFASNTWFSKNKTYSNEVKFKGLVFQLDEGDWHLANKYDWHIMGIQSDGVTLVQIENNTIKALMEINQLTTSGKRQALVSEWLNTAYFKTPTDGCYEKSEYYFVKFWQEGMSANCLRIRHIDVKKEMYNPDYNVEATGYSEPYNWAGFKNFVKKKDLEIPKILISSQHFYNSPFHGGRAFLVYIDVNPEFLGVGKTQIGDENNSEYHKSNLIKHPKKKKLIEDIIQQSFVYHKEFENKLKVKDYQKLDLGVSENKKKGNKDKSIVSGLQKLNELFKSGAISKKEFEAAKKKLLK